MKATTWKKKKHARKLFRACFTLCLLERECEQAASNKGLESLSGDDA